MRCCARCGKRKRKSKLLKTVTLSPTRRIVRWFCQENCYSRFMYGG